MRYKIFLIPAILFLSGCVGSNFIRVPDQSLQFGKTMKNTIFSQIGKPYEKEVIQVNGVDITKLRYVFVKTRGGVGVYHAIMPSRFQSFYYQEDKLIGYEFQSSNQSDSTFFKDADAEKLKEGMHVDSVIEIMGPPHGRLSYPFVDKGMEQYKYSYFHVKSPFGEAFNEEDIAKRELLVTINADRQVSEISFTKTGKWMYMW